MKGQGMKKLLVLLLTGALGAGGALTSYAAYESDGSYSQGNGIASLKSAIESQREYVEVTLPSQIEELETVTIPELEEELENARAAYELDLAENPHSIDPMLKLHLDFVESSLEQSKRDVDNLKSELETEKASLARMEEELEQRTNLAYGNNWSDGYYSPSENNNSATSSENSSKSYSLTQKFWIENNSGEYFLVGKYRSWQKLMGGSWEYDSAVTPNLEISFYEGDDCLESSLSRAESYDTETTLAWYLPDGLSSSNTYVIEINGQYFKVLMYGGSSSTKQTESDSSNVNDLEEISESFSNSEQTVTVDYPGFYDSNLADGIPNEIYYAQSSDGGWLVSLGADFSAYSGYEKSTGREMVKGWLCKDGRWYTFDSVGHQVTGWIPVGGYWYIITPGTEAESCYMLTGWQEINSHWYYFNSSGQMVADCVVDGYSIGSDGIWVQ